MINPKIFKAVLMAATKETKDIVLEELINHISRNYDYNDAKAGHVVEMLVDKNALVTANNINFDWIKKNINSLIYKGDDYLIKNISIGYVDNIECTINIRYEYLEKINEDRDDCSYTSSYINVNFIENQQMLK